MRRSRTSSHSHSQNRYKDHNFMTMHHTSIHK
uniref:Uncharacterized protein n=1 Tax=Rhizophora mucronata TaxID=61149 RepID=A0A2P2JBT8_RHIMU